MDKAHSILLVEDDDFIRQEISEALEDEGYRVSTAAHGKEALAILADGTRPTVVLLDLMMPVMDGWQLLEVLRRHNELAEIPVVGKRGKDVATGRRLPLPEQAPRHGDPLGHPQRLRPL